MREASPPGKRWPSWREARALVIGSLPVRGWVWWLSINCMGGCVDCRSRAHDPGRQLADLRASDPGL